MGELTALLTSSPRGQRLLYATEIIISLVIVTIDANGFVDVDIFGLALRSESSDHAEALLV